MTLRILGGNLGGRLLHAPKSAQTRPTTSMLRKAVFDILQGRVLECRFLDLFAGSGAMGIEALSRGASHASFIENHRDALRTIHHNITTFNLQQQAVVYPAEVLTVLKKLEKKEELFDIIYADPPYHRTAVYLELLAYFDTSLLLSPGGTLFLESITPAPFSWQELQLCCLTHVDTRRFGTSLLHQYRRCSLPSPL